MIRKCALSFCLGAAGLAAVLASPAHAADPQYSKTPKTIKIGGGSGWDYLYADAVGRRCYVTHGTKVVVIDMDSDKVVGEIADTPGVHGFVTVPDLKKGFSSNGQENKVSIVDLDTLKTLSKVDTGGNPDAILYSSGTGEVYTFNGRSNNSTAIDAKTGAVNATIDLGGKPETAVCDPAAGKIYDNLEDKSSIVRVDLKTHKVDATWPITGGDSPSGLAMDHELHRLIIGCANEKMVMMDSESGKVVDTAPCGQGVDASAFDPGTHYGFVSCGGTGTVTVVKVTADKLVPVQTLPTVRQARTMTVDTKTHKIYLSYAPSRTDTTGFTVLVYSLEGETPTTTPSN
jgi:YVTN family beta-propeller protein